MAHPFQKLCYLSKDDRGLLLAAGGSHLYSFCSVSGEMLSTWPSRSDDDLSDVENRISAETDHTREPPSKKRRLSANGDGTELSDSSVSVEIVAERAKGQRRRRKIVDSKLPKASHLIATKDAKHVIAVTVEDKCIRVFQLGRVSEGGERGRLKLLSKRCMPKRLCAIVLTPDDSTILAADKFGDVYSLPLQDIPSLSDSASHVTRKPAAEFKPSASELTVHTKGNLEALRQQREQKAAAKTKEGPNFEHKLLLGHVSLLTDLVIAEAEVLESRRQFILTADRDEHIRVSRGPSQAHIIENYCLGHKEFVSKLCILPWRPDILVTGSGETSIKSFHWSTGKPVGDLSVFQVMSDAISKSTHDLSEHKPLRKLAVSGIWPMNAQDHGYLAEKCGFVLVAFEGLPLLLSLEWTANQGLVYHQTVDLPGNALDVARMQEDVILVSTDNVHMPGAVKQMRTDPAALADSIVSFQLESEHVRNAHGTERYLSWKPSDLTAPLSASLDSGTFVGPELASQPNAKATYSVLGEFLYGLENLRKNRSGMEAAEEILQDDVLRDKDIGE